MTQMEKLGKGIYSCFFAVESKADLTDRAFSALITVACFFLFACFFPHSPVIRSDVTM